MRKADLRLNDVRNEPDSDDRQLAYCNAAAALRALADAITDGVVAAVEAFDLVAPMLRQHAEMADEMWREDQCGDMDRLAVAIVRKLHRVGNSGPQGGDCEGP